MVFKKKTKTKNQTREFVDGQEVPQKIPDLEVPAPINNDNNQIEERQRTADEVFAEGRSVGFPEGMIYVINMADDHLRQHQEELRKKQRVVQQ